MSKLEAEMVGVMNESAAVPVQQYAGSSPAQIRLPLSGLQSVLVLGSPLAAVAIYFIAGKPLWAVLALAALSLASYLFPAWQQIMTFPRLVFAFLALTFIINTFGIAYPYSNIFVLTGLLGLFALSGMTWKSLQFLPGKTGRWGKTALGIALGLAAITLLIYFWRPALLGENPTPREWPVDVIIMMALGYAIFSALMEETVFRGVLMAYCRQYFSADVAIFAQALIFAMMHYRVGFPMNLAGAVLALLWGLGAGWLVKRAESIYPAYLMHFVIVLSLFLALAFT